ncbi:MAG: sialate O-acetylesterase, partial [Planctomycetota bacterium]
MPTTRPPIRWILVPGVLACALAAGAPRAEADPQLASVFGDHMVLQQEKPVVIWGRAAPGEALTVEIAGRQAETSAGRRGRWRVTLDALPAPGPYTLRVRGKTTVTLSDVLVGEVWICSGQSNMAMTVAACFDAEEEISAADLPQIRLLTVGRRGAAEPAEDFRGSWTRCSQRTVRSFSAVGFFFGRTLFESLGVPIGLVDTSYGGTPAEAWTPRPALEREPTLAPLVERWTKAARSYDAKAARRRYEKALARWEKAAAKAKAAGKPPPRKPRLAPDPRENVRGIASLWNAMVAPLVPFAVRGVIWYQGESNAARAYQYRTLFPLMIKSWRAAWKEDLPFYFVQLANFRERKPQPGESAWAELREAQRLTLREVPNTGMAVAIDIGEAGTIHPRNKQDVGKRLADWALAGPYGLAVEPSGPLYRESKRRGRTIRIRFDHVGKSLAAHGGPLRGFTIAGKDRRFHPAQARIEGDEVVVTSPEVAHPVAVRYGWADNPDTNLYNAADLPASPFRTDDWPGLTAAKN